MKILNGILILLVLAAGSSTSSCADDPALTRPEMKARLEALKQRSPRIPLPPPTEEERASGRSLVNNGRLRSLYLPASWNSWLISEIGRAHV